MSWPFWGLVYYGGPGAFGTPEGAQWAERADRYAQPDTVDRAWADIALGAVRYRTGHAGKGYSLLSRALDLSRRLDDPFAFELAASFWLMVVRGPQHGEELLRVAEELTTRLRTRVSTRTIRGGAFMYIGSTFLAWGLRPRAEEMWRELGELADRNWRANEQMFSMVANSVLASLDGRLEDAVSMGHGIAALGDELVVSGIADLFSSLAGGRPLLYLGKGEDALQIAIFPQQKALCLAHRGRHEEVTALLEELVLARPGIGSDADETGTELDILLLEAAVLAEHREATGLLLRRFAGTKLRTTDHYYTTCIARHLGAAAALLGRPDEARGYYQTALEVCREMPFRPEEALTHLQLAELLLEHYPEAQAEALEHLDTAIPEFCDMKMQPYLERALRHRETLNG